MRIIAAFLFSTIIHIALLYSTIPHESSAAQQKNKPTQVAINVMEKSRNDKVKDLPKAKGRSVTERRSSKKKLECKKYYTGIGILTQPDTCHIKRVFKGYSADKAGLLAGDLIISPHCSQIRGAEGSTIDMTVIRDGQALNLVIKREKICERDSKKP